MLTMPRVGAYADVRAAKKRLLILVTNGCVVGTSAPAAARPGAVLLASGLVLLLKADVERGRAAALAAAEGA